VALLLGFVIVSPASAADKQNWLDGRIALAEVSGQRVGHGDHARSRLWWTYSVDAGGHTYVVVSRRSPSRLRLAVPGPVRVVPARDRVVLLDGEGREQQMQVVREAAAR